MHIDFKMYVKFHKTISVASLIPLIAADWLSLTMLTWLLCHKLKIADLLCWSDKASGIFGRRRSRLPKNTRTPELRVLNRACWNGTISFETFIETYDSCCVSRFSLIAIYYKIIPSAWRIIGRTLSLKPGVSKLFVRGPHMLLHDSSRAGLLTYRHCFGKGCIPPDQQFFR